MAATLFVLILAAAPTTAVAPRVIVGLGTGRDE
jgi:hypothetical protein